MVKIPFVPHIVFVQSFFSPLRADPPGSSLPSSAPGSDKPDFLSTACQCTRCKLTSIHGDLLRLATDLPEAFEKRAVDAADSVFDIIRTDPGTCLFAVDVLQRLKSEMITVEGSLQGIRLKGIYDDLKAYFERIDK